MVSITSKELRKEHLEQSLSQATTSKKAKPVEPSKATAIGYNARLQQLVRAIKKDIDTEITPLVRSLAPQYTADSFIDLVHDGEMLPGDFKIRRIVKDGWVADITAALGRVFTKWTGFQFEQLANETAATFVRTADQVNQAKFQRSMKSLGIDVFGESPALSEMLAAAAYDNSKLIQSIPAQYLKQVESIVMTNMRAGLRPSSITKALVDQFGITTRRARMIARDQTAKVNGDINKKRQEAAGFDYFQWSDSDDARVRDRHETIANKVTAYGKGVYRWDNPPLSDKGEQIIPGSDYNCRCVGIPVSQRQVDENIAAGSTNPSVKR